jgi:hypothetical protein
MMPRLFNFLGSIAVFDTTQISRFLGFPVALTDVYDIKVHRFW